MPRSCAHWQDLLERYGKWEAAHKRFSRWAAGSSLRKWSSKASVIRIASPWIIGSLDSAAPRVRPPKTAWSAPSNTISLRKARFSAP